MKWSLVIRAAQRHYEYMRQPEKEQERQEKFQEVLKEIRVAAGIEGPPIKGSLTVAEPEDDKLNLDRLADYISDNWPDKKYSLEEIAQRLHATWPGAFMPAEPVKVPSNDATDAARWRKARTLPRSWWRDAFNRVSTPEELEALIDTHGERRLP